MNFDELRAKTNQNNERNAQLLADINAVKQECRKLDTQLTKQMIDEADYESIEVTRRSLEQKKMILARLEDEYQRFQQVRKVHRKRDVLSTEEFTRSQLQEFLIKRDEAIKKLEPLEREIIIIWTALDKEREILHGILWNYKQAFEQAGFQNDTDHALNYGLYDDVLKVVDRDKRIIPECFRHGRPYYSQIADQPSTEEINEALCSQAKEDSFKAEDLGLIE